MVLEIKVDDSIAKKLIDLIKTFPIDKISFREIDEYSHIEATNKEEEAEIVEILKDKECFEVVKESERSIKKILKRKEETHQNLIDSNIKRGALKELFEDLEVN